MTPPRAIWLDCCFVPQRYDLCRIAADFCEPHRLAWPADVLAAVRACRPDFVCVEYDYPNRARLGVIPLLRQRFPGLRVLMFTDYHTEPLAVWAFRNRVWEYRVKPVTEGVFARLVETLGRSGAALPPRGWLADAFPPDLIAPSGQLRRPVGALPRTAAAVAYVGQHYAEVVRIDTAARLCRMSQSEFSRTFHTEHGMSFRRFLLDHRMRMARTLLTDSRAPVSQVAYAVGFNDLSHFGRLFRRYAGEPPTRYRERLRQAERQGAQRQPAAA